jgi:hypothetical protein
MRHRVPPVIRSVSVLLAIGACSGPSQGDQPPTGSDTATTQVQQVLVYRACDGAAPGELAALSREVPADMDPVVAAISEMLRGVNDAERARGCSSFFSSATENALRAVNHNARGDTVQLDFRDFSDAIPDRPGAKSFLPPGVMAELTWTIFQQFPSIEAVRFSFDGDDRGFWGWLGGEGTEPETYTRTMWERI